MTSETVLLDGRSVADSVLQQVKIKTDKFYETHRIYPTLAIIAVGLSEAGKIYVDRKISAAANVGIRVIFEELNFVTSEAALKGAVEELARREDVHGILIQLPLPKFLHVEKVLSWIPVEKDVDGITAQTLGAYAAGEEVSAPPCTAAGILKLLEAYKVEVSGKTALVIGRGRVAGLGISIALMRADATVITAHSKTKNIAQLARVADIVVVAVGKAGFLRTEWLKSGAVLIDVGCNVGEDGSVRGDADENAAANRVDLSFRSPVPGGVGPMTVAMLLANTLRLAELSSVK